MSDSTPGLRRTVRRWVIGLCLVGLVIMPGIHLLRAWWSDSSELAIRSPFVPGDASKLEASRIQIPWAPSKTSAVADIQQALAIARERNLPVSIAGARHSQGGHTIAPDGLQIDMGALDHMELLDGGVLRVGAGARWNAVISFLDARGRSPLVMQSDADFSVGGTISVNAHGWQPHMPPIGSTVRRLRVIDASGRDFWCSRTVEPEFFRHVIGGYGLFGVIVEAELDTTANRRYRVDAAIVDREALFQRFPDGNNPSDVGLEYARLDPRPASRFREALYVRYVAEPGDSPPPPLEAPGLQGLRRTVFRGSIGSRYGKRLRWNLERASTLLAHDTVVTRNSVMSDTSGVVLDHSATETDILHEYFLPRRSVQQFLAETDAIVTESGADLLNVTVRDVRRDTDSALPWATADVVAFVMYFHQARTSEAEAEMQAMTRRLIDVAIRLGGRYYLPYRRHASASQLLAAYPMWPEFVDAKRRLDPTERFQNRFWQEYASASEKPSP